MEIVIEWMKMDDGVELYVREWLAKDVPPRAIIQLAHGMAEHIGRYEEFAEFLVSHGFHVIGNDHRGHGHTGERAGIFGYFADDDGFERAVDDLFTINQRIHHQFLDVPVFLMGHSMGSFLTRRYIQKYADTVNGAILSGTGGPPGVAGKLGKFIAKREMNKNGRKTPSPLMDRLIFGSYNKGFEEVKSKFAWLSRDPEVVENYMNDPHCGFVCTSGFYYDLLTGLEIIHKDANIRQIPKKFPLLIFSGEKDPVGANSFGVKRVIHQYEKNGLVNIESIFYKGGRHEMLNELNKREVYNDVLRWLEKQLAERIKWNG